MGARPVANLNALRFGEPSHEKTRHLVSGVVAGIGGYGNCVGVPTVGGACDFDASYNGNNLVNAMTVGIANADRIFYATASGIGNPVVYVGSKTGRDGIHGATMASAEFDDQADAKRPTVQVGDPFTEKLLIEACLELMAEDVIIGIQDMGAAGLTSSAFEMAGKGGVGVELDLSVVPIRETGMTPYEIMLSESQERMLMVLKPGREDVARTIFEKWELDFAVIGTLTDSGRMVLRMDGAVVADLPIDPLAEAAPIYDRPTTSTPLPAALDGASVPAPDDLMAALETLVGSADLCSKRWIWDQYDHMVMADTVARPGGDAAIVRIHGTERGLALTTDCNPRYCFAHPQTGGAQAVAEAWRNLTAVGARPLAITDNMNFGNPERPEIMGQFADCIEGIREACLALDFPVVSGNVSFYNETNGKGILPTPAIGAVGVLDDISKSVSLPFKAEGEDIVVIGEIRGHLGCSAYMREILDRRDGPPPPVDLAVERANGDFVRGEITAKRLTACHDISDGGLLVALAEMAMASDIGATLTVPDGAPALHAWAFGEDQGGYVLTAPDGAALVARAQKAGLKAALIGRTGGAELTLSGTGTISVARLRAAHEGWFPTYMGDEGIETR
jgi:phosphoribosylformylglycinamidine synthase II